MEEVKQIKKLILLKLVRSNIWGGKHTPFDFIKNGIPQHYRNTHKGQKVLEEIIKELINNEWIILTAKRTGKGSDDHISLNPRKVSEIRQFLEHESENNSTAG